MKKVRMIFVMILTIGLLYAPTVYADSSSDAAASAVLVLEQATVSTVLDPRELPGATPVFPMVIPLIQGGRVGDVTGQIVKFAIPATPYANGDKVVRILKIVKGSIFDRVRLEDIELDLLNGFKAIVEKFGSKDFNLAKVKYLVQYKDSAVGVGIGGGGAGAISGLNGGASSYGGTGSLAVLPGYTRSTADPMYIIKFFLVE